MLDVRLKDWLRLLRLVFAWSFSSENVDGPKTGPWLRSLLVLIFPVLIGPGPVQSRSFCSLATGPPNTTRRKSFSVAFYKLAFSGDHHSPKIIYTH